MFMHHASYKSQRLQTKMEEEAHFWRRAVYVIHYIMQWGSFAPRPQTNTGLGHAEVMIGKNGPSTKMFSGNEEREHFTSQMSCESNLAMTFRSIYTGKCIPLLLRSGE